MRILDSRRLTGPSLLLDRPGAILEVEQTEAVDPVRVTEAWRVSLASLLAALGWQDAATGARVHLQGLTLAHTAPVDVLYAATEVNEAAWHAAVRALGLAPASEAAEHPDATIARLRDAVERERKPWLLDLEDRARSHDVMLLSDDRRTSVGLGTGSRAWPTEDAARQLERIPWSKVHDIPIALVTGTNGKTTTVRLLAAIADAAGKVAGTTSTDAVTVGAEIVAEGDYSGPNGARTVLRDRRVEVAVLELARGGILRRGLAVPRATVALVTNVANDHLGEFGIFDLGALADVKMVVAKAVRSGGRLVLNADDPLLLERGRALGSTVTWFTLDASHPEVRAHVAGGGEACVLEGEALCRVSASGSRAILGLEDLPIALSGAARHNVANALAAMAVATSLGFRDDAIQRGLRGFHGDSASNPGRTNVWRLGGVTAVVDFAHNPHGLEALARMVAQMPAARRAVVLGQAGDRDDAAIRELARTAWAMHPDHVFIKEMDVYRRGREPGVIPELLQAELRRCGAPSSALGRYDTELEAIRAALSWARDGDLLLLTTHAQREDVIALVTRLAASGWRPGDPVEAASSA